MSDQVRLPAKVVTPRLVLRLWRYDDAGNLSRAIEESLDHLRPWMDWAKAEPIATEDRRKLIEDWRSAWEKGGDSVLGIFKNGEVIGGTGLHRRGDPAMLEIGYWIHADHINRGYATEAARALTAAAFDVPGIERVEIHHDKANQPSASVPRKLGFSYVGEETREIRAPAEAGVHWGWVMIRQSWLERQR